MQVSRLRRNGQIYIKLLVGITICIVFTLLLSSSIYYMNYSDILQKQAYKTDLGNLGQTSREVVGLTQSAQAVSFQIYRNSTITKLLFYNKPNVYDVQAAMGDLANYLNSMPFIESIYVYNPAASSFYIAAEKGQNGIFTVNELEDTDILNVLNHFGDYKPFSPIPRRYKLTADDPEPTAIYTYLCYDAIGFDSKINSAVMINISSSWINRDIGLTDGEGGRTYILNDRGGILSGNDLSPQNWSSDEAELLHSRVQGRKADYIIANFQGKKSLISFTSPDSLSWQYVRITPYDLITKKIANVRRMTIEIAAGILLAGLLLAWVLSRILYVPIQQIVTRVHSLETEKRDSSFAIRQNALRKLLQMHSFHPKLQLEKLAALGITFDFTQNYRLVYLRFDRFEELKKQHSNDLTVLRFAIMNIASEIGSKSYCVETIGYDEDGILLLANVLPEGEEPSVLSVLEQIRNACLEYVKIGVTIAYSPVDCGVQHLHPMFKLTKEATSYRFFRGQGSIIDAAEIESYKTNEYAFPANKEKRLVENLMSGKTEEAKTLIGEILKETSDYPLHVVRSAVSRLTMTMNNLLCEIKKNASIKLDWHANADIGLPYVDTFETLEELTACYFAFFDQIKIKLSDKRSGKQENISRRVNALIEERYADPNLSLNGIADELELSSFHVSRVYRQQTFAAIVDVINKTRMDKAQELLRQTELSIVEIAERTGYTNSSYFHRMFKKTFGVTPAEFRKSDSVRSENKL
ncbi:AraC family transcriptional regulator [Paenibacillus sp. OV219]|uniref:AraC family transcriptional regulator n=1 Tax=Paenibacillus sp. OV219 TaxID=1884377 RepID=UPI0008D05BE4|nr:AraC family transcriptional regulator [Paenibacillus sp. OV219]SEN96804.1 Helix-turn-helix domain-containing protein [Paenibacillus sp. OV219]